ncbi:hypothetical protein ACS0TY_006334 [Phlomoides rotata]
MVHAKCKGVECKWNMHAYNIHGEQTFQIRVYNPTHTCLESYHIKSIKSRYINGRYGYQFLNNPKKKVSHFKDDVSYELGVHISKHQAYKAKKLALMDSGEDLDEHYKLLWDYAHEVRRANPRSTVNLCADDSLRNIGMIRCMFAWGQ